MCEVQMQVQMRNHSGVNATSLLEMAREESQEIQLLSVDIAQRQAEYKILQADLECINQNNWV